MTIFNGCNSHIWSAPLVLLIPAVVVFVAAFKLVKKGHHYLCDPKHNKGDCFKDAGDFGPHLQRYQDLSKLTITLSAGAIAFLINTMVGQKSPVSGLAQKICS